MWPALFYSKAPFIGAGAGWSPNPTRPESMGNYSQPASEPRNGTGMNEVGTSKAWHAIVSLDGTLCTGIRASLGATYVSSTKNGVLSGEDRINMHPWKVGIQRDVPTVVIWSRMKFTCTFNVGYWRIFGIQPKHGSQILSGWFQFWPWEAIAFSGWKRNPQMTF